MIDNQITIREYYIHQQDALLTRTVNIQRFSDESTRLKSRNDQSELWGECRS
ncbi:hypothetical protein CQ228_003224 [Salmonella enterica subsp. enterica serovar Oranienburg]|nr:hypothetical protein [Salmonella enterica]EED9778226.1 hypothetical protein [Salmonella enterica subsp. enterica serovar Oranienburg]EEE2288834.1 hypothetical protein [Salmonella enterica subsp. enterica serovar Oranienburg]